MLNLVEAFTVFLVFMSVVLLLFYILPFALILACPPQLMGKTRCGRKLALQYKPIFDAFYNPFKERYTFWIGMRCIIRVVPLILAGLTTYPSNVFGITVFAMCFLLLHEIIEPFKDKLKNKVETYFLINLLLFAVGTLYYPQIETFFDDTISSTYIIVLVVFAYGGLLFVLILYIHIRFPIISMKIKECWKKAKHCCCRCCCCRHKEKKNDTKIAQDEIDWSTKDDRSLSIIETVPKAVTYTELREPLLESGQVLLSTVTVSTST